MKFPEIPMHNILEGKLEVPGGESFYRIYNPTGVNTPLVIEPGGPGFDGVDGDMDPYRFIAQMNDCPVILRDPVGCGRSKLPNQETQDYSHLWTIDRSAREVAEASRGIRAILGVKMMHTGGFSAGGIFVAEAIIRRYLDINMVKSIILQSPVFNLPLFKQESAKLLTKINPGAMEIIDNYEALGYFALQVLAECKARGDTESNEYKAANDAINNQEYMSLANSFDQLHIFGEQLPADNLPPELVRSNEHFEQYGVKIFQKMIGPFRLSEVNPAENGEFYEYDILRKLHILGQRPTLIAVGEHDEVTPLQGRVYQQNIPGSKLIFFEESAHMMHWTNPAYLQAVSDHMRDVDLAA